MNPRNENRPDARKIAEFSGHRESIYALASMSEGAEVYSAGGDGLVVSWATKHNPEAAGTVVARVSGSVYAMCSVSSLNLLFIGQNQSGIHRIDLTTGVSTAVSLGPTAIFDIRYKAAGRLIYVGTGSGELISVHADSMEVVRNIHVSDTSVRAIALHPSGHELAVGSSDHHIRVYRITDDEPVLVNQWEGHGHSVFTLDYSPDGKYLLSAGRDAAVKKWDAANGYTAIGSVKAHMHSIHQVTCSPDGKHFLTCSMDKTIKIWSSVDLQLLRVLDRSRHGGHNNSVNRLIWLDGHRFASAGDDRRLILWQLISNNNSQ